MDKETIINKLSSSTSLTKDEIETYTKLIIILNDSELLELINIWIDKLLLAEKQNKIYQNKKQILKIVSLKSLYN